MIILNLCFCFGSILHTQFATWITLTWYRNGSCCQFPLIVFLDMVNQNISHRDDMETSVSCKYIGYIFYSWIKYKTCLPKFQHLA